MCLARVSLTESDQRAHPRWLSALRACKGKACKGSHPYCCTRAGLNMLPLTIPVNNQTTHPLHHPPPCPHSLPPTHQKAVTHPSTPVHQLHAAYTSYSQGTHQGMSDATERYKHNNMRTLHKTRDSAVGASCRPLQQPPHTPDSTRHVATPAGPQSQRRNTIW